MKAQWLFFDLDGTLADSLPGLRSSIIEALGSAGRTLHVDDLRPYIGPGIRVILKNLEADLTETELDGMERCFRASYDNHGVLDASLFDGVKQTLEGLRAGGAELFLVTNKPKYATANLMARYAMTGLFREMVSRNSRDPDYANKAEMMQELVNRYGVDVHHAVMVGDTAEDFHAAQATGMMFAFVEYGYGELAVNVDCTRVSHFAELAAIYG